MVTTCTTKVIPKLSQVSAKHREQFPVNTTRMLPVSSPKATQMLFKGDMQSDHCGKNMRELPKGS